MSFRVTVEGQEFRVLFAHRRAATNVNKAQFKVITSCAITDGKTILAQGATKCSVNDNFCRATGRKVALSRALAEMPGRPYDPLHETKPTWDEAQRRAVWNAYWTAVRQPMLIKDASRASRRAARTARAARA